MTMQNEWSGQVGDVWAEEWRRTDRSFAQLTRSLVNAVLAAAPERGRAVDIGCGAGEIGLALAAARPELAVTGVDISPGLLAVARERGEGVANLDFRLGDAAGLAAALGPVDLYVSRHGVMFFDDPGAAFAAFRAAAAPGARLVFSCFRDWRENGFYTELAEAIGVAPPDPVAPGPFAFADRDRVAALLEGAGWREVDAEAVDFAYRAGEGPNAVDAAARFLTRIGPAARELRLADPATRDTIRARVRAVMESRHRDGAVDFPAAAWIWSARA